VCCQLDDGVSDFLFTLSAIFLLSSMFLFHALATLGIHCPIVTCQRVKYIADT